MRKTVSHRPHPMLRAVASLAAVALALGACGGSTGAAQVTGSGVVASSAPAAPTATPIISSAIAPSSSPLAALPLLWQGGTTTTSQPSFQALAVDPKTGDVWASMPFENLFWLIDSKGTYRESWGTSGSGPGQFDLNDHLQTPDGFGAIAFAPDGTFYVGDVGNHRVEKFDAARRFVKAWGTFGHGDGQFGQITSVATDGTTVLVGDGDRGDVQAFDPNGKYLRTFGADGGFAAFVAIDLAGNAYATNPSVGKPAVAKFDPTGKEVGRFDMSAIGDAVGVAVDPSGHVFVGAASTTYPYGGIGTYELSPDLRTSLRGWSTGGGGYLALSLKGDTLYISGWHAWPDVQAYAVPAG